VVRSILSWEACARAERRLDRSLLRELLARRDTARAEDLIRAALHDAQGEFEKMYRG
jgi:xylose isomerase